FSRLPGELRNMIWELALLDLVDEKPQLCFYRAGCWVTELSPEGHFSLTFDHKRLHPIAVSVPLFFVNREARSYARAWIQERGLQIRFDKETQCLGIYRPVNPDRDTLYVPEARFECFQDEPAALKHGFRAAGVRISGWPRSFMRLAFPAALFSND
ncbi:2EXR domain-containing protein, partial [Aspergillus homomorphus CBS 101889]